MFHLEVGHKDLQLVLLLLLLLLVITLLLVIILLIITLLLVILVVFNLIGLHLVLGLRISIELQAHIEHTVHTCSKAGGILKVETSLHSRGIEEDVCKLGSLLLGLVVLGLHTIVEGEDHRMPGVDLH